MTANPPPPDLLREIRATQARLAAVASAARSGSATPTAAAPLRGLGALQSQSRLADFETLAHEAITTPFGRRQVLNDSQANELLPLKASFPGAYFSRTDPKDDTWVLEIDVMEAASW